MERNPETGRFEHVGEPDDPEQRAAAREIVRAELAARRSMLVAMSERARMGKLGEKAAALVTSLDDWARTIEQAGGEDGLMFLVCANVANGALLTDVCAEFGIDYGLLYVWIERSPERLEQYQAALRAVADRYMAATVGIADSATPEDVQVKKLSVETRLKLAPKYDLKRFGDRNVGGGGAAVSVTVIHQSH